MTTRTVLVLSLLLLLLIPIFVHAQESDEERLRAEIRAALMQDPRSVALSDEEFDQMVNALTEETIAQGAVNDFVVPVTFTTVEGENGYVFYGYTVSEPILYGLVLLGLAIGIAAIRFAVDHHRQVPIQGA